MTEQTAARQWREGYQRVVALIRDADASDHRTQVPACPDWTVRELFAHMVAVGTDALNGDVPDDTNPQWTKGQLEQRADAPVDELLAEWAEHADDIEAFVGGTDPTPLADLLIHEQDLRGALDAPGARDTEGLALVRDTVLGQVHDSLAQATDGPLELRAIDREWSWRSGSGEPGAVVAAPMFELFRSITSRRTASQVRGWTVSGSIDPYLDAFAGMGPLPSTPLAE